MDPVSAIGAVSSVLALAQTALKLSQALYSFISAIRSAPEDLRTLADGLDTFSTSLKVLDGLLNKDESRFSSEVYVLVKKIIKGCQDLYGKLDKVLLKLGSKSKDSMRWKLRVKFVYKEDQILKLRQKLGEMKADLSLILQTAQLELSVRWIDNSRPNKTQRSAETELQDETLGVLSDARSSEKHDSDTKVKLPRLPPVKRPDDDREVSTESDLPSSEFAVTASTSPGVSKTSFSTVTQLFSSFVAPTAPLDPGFSSRDVDFKAPSLKSSSSIESFQSAQEIHMESVPEFKAIQGILHAFKFALEVLAKVVQERVRKEHEIKSSSDHLKISLQNGDVEIRNVHKLSFRDYGQQYFRNLAEFHTPALQDIHSIFMKEVVMVLHLLIYEDEDLSRPTFDGMYSWSEICRTRAIFEIEGAATQSRSSPNIPGNVGTRFFGLASSPVNYNNPQSDDGWESAEEIDSNLAYGIDTPWRWGLGLARMIGLAKKRHKLLTSKSSIVDPSLFGPANSLNGLVSTPVGFDEISWSSCSDFGEQSWKLAKHGRSDAENFGRRPGLAGLAISQNFSDLRQPSPINPQSRDRSSYRYGRSSLPGSNDDDLDFAATMAAGLQDTGFDPNIMIIDPSSHRRRLSLSSNHPGLHHTSFAETISELGPDVSGAFRPSLVPIQHSLPILSVSPSIYEPSRSSSARTLKSVYPVATSEEYKFDGYFTESKLSKKEQKKRDKSGRRREDLGDTSSVVTDTHDARLIEPNPEDSKLQSEMGGDDHYSNNLQLLDSIVPEHGWDVPIAVKNSKKDKKKKGKSIATWDPDDSFQETHTGNMDNTETHMSNHVDKDQEEHIRDNQAFQESQVDDQFADFSVLKNKKDKKKDKKKKNFRSSLLQDLDVIEDNLLGPRVEVTNNEDSRTSQGLGANQGEEYLRDPKSLLDSQVSDEWSEQWSSSKKSKKKSERHTSDYETKEGNATDTEESRKAKDDSRGEQIQVAQGLPDTRIEGEPPSHDTHSLSQAVDKEARANDIWWEAYFSLRSSHPIDFALLSKEIEDVFNHSELQSTSTQSESLSTRIAHLSPSESWMDDYPGMDVIAQIRTKIIKIMIVMDEQLGMQIATVAWECVYKALVIYDGNTIDSHDDFSIEALSRTLSQLQEIVNIVSRFAIMENFYRQTSSLVIQQDYKEAILDLCITILRYFVQAFSSERAIGKDETEEKLARSKIMFAEVDVKHEVCKKLSTSLEAAKESDEEEDEDEIWSSSGDEMVRESEESENESEGNCKPVE